MVLVTGGAVAAVAGPAIALLGPVGGSAAAAATVSGAAAVGLPGATAGATVLALGEGALVGAGAIGGGSSAGIALATLAGPIGWLIVGCNEKNDGHKGDGGGGYTWDCWKPVVRDTSARPSHGMTLRCLAAHPNVRSVSLSQGGLLVGNAFDEHFRLTPVSVDGTLALHASILVS